MSENKDRVYAPAMNWSAPRDEAPDFIKAKVGIKVDEFVAFLKENMKESGWINFEMKERAKTDATTSSSIHGSRSHRLKKTLRSDSPLTPSDGLGRGATAPLSFGD
jgi:hypothetical protein